MCLIVYKPTNVAVSEILFEGIQAAYRQNGDGWGWMKQSNDLKNITYKKYSKDTSLLKIEQDINDLCLKSTDYFAFHGRIGTRGNKSIDNTHPFKVGLKLHEFNNTLDLMYHRGGVSEHPLLMHNGCVSTYALSQEFSDTYDLANTVFANTPYEEILDSENFMKNNHNLDWQKILIFYPNKYPIKLGNFTQDNGLYFSHGGYRTYGFYDVGGTGYFNNKPAPKPTKKVLEIDNKTVFNVVNDEYKSKYQDVVSTTIRTNQSNNPVSNQPSIVTKMHEIDLDIEVDDVNIEELMFITKNNFSTKFPSGKVDYAPGVKINLNKSHYSVFDLNSKRDLIKNSTIHIRPNSSNDLIRKYYSYNKLCQIGISKTRIKTYNKLYEKVKKHPSDYVKVRTVNGIELNLATDGFLEFYRQKIAS